MQLTRFWAWDKCLPGSGDVREGDMSCVKLSWDVRAFG